MDEAASDKLGKEINELSQLLEEVTIPYRGTEKLRSKQKGSTKKPGPRGNATQWEYSISTRS